jgi:hypothetical protein
LSSLTGGRVLRNSRVKMKSLEESQLRANEPDFRLMRVINTGRGDEITMSVLWSIERFAATRSNSLTWAV